ncbi:hypothetical protein ACFW4X_05515 [Streptomyces smyrnaeus]|uniref:hypothetical protein n=1 Tax=Streptomyces smyrnaeus TaxID=1387713 RepID=UPI003410484A
MRYVASAVATLVVVGSVVTGLAGAAPAADKEPVTWEECMRGGGMPRGVATHTWRCQGGKYDGHPVK